MARQKRAVHVFEVSKEVDGLYTRHSPADGFENTAEAKAWLKDQAGKLEGKDIAIGSMLPTVTLKVVTTSRVTLE